MNILLLGSGGREHAMAWKIKQSSHCNRLFVAPGNAGTSLIAENADIGVNDFGAIKDFCLSNHIGMLVVGPEEPLVKGIVDFFSHDEMLKHISVIGPSAYGAQLEGSKAFSKAFMQRNHIPTASYREFDASNFSEGINYLKAHRLPIVLKADGLAAGKGVIIAQTHEEALNEFEQMIKQSKFGEASKKVVVEEFLSGIEVSVFVLTDGNDYKIIGHAKDYKRIGEGDKGANTGGMGAVTPVPFCNEVFMKKVEERIIQPTINGLKEEKIDYKGFVFVGLIKVNDEPYVIEYNCRMGDPETEVVMPRLKNDLVELFMLTSQQQIAEATIEYEDRSIATIVAVSKGYPDVYEKGFVIEHSEDDFGEDTIVFHAGTKKQQDAIITNGGRVLAITSYGDSISSAVNLSKQALKKISFNGMYYRSDIGYEFM
jgi:phosphoribosylamine--glycine ligase